MYWYKYCLSGVYADDWIEVGKLKPIISKKIVSF